MTRIWNPLKWSIFGSDIQCAIWLMAESAVAEPRNMSPPLDAKWSANRCHWRARMPWLSTGRSPDGKLLHVTCKLCERHDDMSAPKWKTVSSLQLCHFKRHDTTPKHMRAAASCIDVVVALHAPPVKKTCHCFNNSARGRHMERRDARMLVVAQRCAR